MSLLPLAVVTVFSLANRLNGDVMYALGGLRTAAAGGNNVVTTFVARPLAYRVVLDGLDRVRAATGGLAGSAPSLHSQIVIRVTTYVLLAVVCWLLWVGLRRHVDHVAAGSTAVAVFGSLLLAPPWHFLEPDWLAVPTAVLAVALALAPRNAYVGAVLSAIAIALTIAIKIATFPLAIGALILIFLVDRRRGWLAAVAGALASVIWLVVFRFITGWEWQWFQDQSSLLHDAPAHDPFKLEFIKTLARTVRDTMLVSPLTFLAIPAAVVLVLHAPSVRRRVEVAVAVVLLFGMAIAPGYAQGEWFMYHFAPVPVLCAAAVGAAFGLRRSARLPLIVLGVFFGLAGYWALHQSYAWRRAHVGVVFDVFLAVALVAAAALAFLQLRSRGADIVGEISASAVRLPVVSIPMVGAAGVALAATLAPPVLNAAPYAFSLYNARAYATTSWTWTDNYARFRNQIGSTTPVMYFAYGTVDYSLNNPTACRYPSPQWLQRAAVMPESVGTKSYLDNLKCLTVDTQTGNAKWLIWQQNWFPVSHAPQAVKDYVTRTFDCSPSKRVVIGQPVIACPRR